MQALTLVRWRRLVTSVGFPVALFLIAFIHLAGSVDVTPFQRDEARWIQHSYYLRLWSDPFGKRWQDEGYVATYGSWDEHYRMRDQPPLASYLLGVGLVVQGERIPPNGYWDMDQDEKWNVAHGNMPSHYALRAARLTNCVLAALTVVVMYLILVQIAGPLGGLLAGLVQAFHPLVLDTATRAWADTALSLFIAVSVLALMYWARRPSWKRAILVGVALGLGASAKLSPLALSGVPAVMSLLFLHVRQMPHGKRLRISRETRQLASVPAFALATFILSYPYLWPNPIVHTYRMFRFRLDSFESQGRSFPQARVHGLPDALTRVGQELSKSASFSGWVAAKLADISHVSLPNAIAPPDWDLLLVVVAIVIMPIAMVRWGLRDARSLGWLFLLAQAALVVLTMGVEYLRYLLPIVLLVSASYALVVEAGRRVIRYTVARTVHRNGTLPTPKPGLPAMEEGRVSVSPRRSHIQRSTWIRL